MSIVKSKFPTHPMPPPEDPFWSLGVLRFNGYNLRSEPNIKSDIIAILSGHLRGMVNTLYSPNVDGYIWVAVYIEEIDRFAWVIESLATEPDVMYFTFIEDD